MRGASGRARPRGGLDRRRHVRRIRRALAADGAVLRPRPRARAVAAGRHARRLRQSDDPPARPRARRAEAGRDGRTSTSVRPTGRRTSPITPAAPRRRRSTSIAGAVAVAAGQAAFDWVYEAVDPPVTLYGARARGRGPLVLRPQRARRSPPSGCSSAAPAPGAIPLWSARYFRFWAAKLLVRSAPAIAFAGTPLYNLYLRLLGAKIGANAVILSRTVPAATADLFEVGEDALVMRSALMPGYTAYGNRIHLDAIRIGRNAYVGEQSVLEIGSAIGDFGQLGHASSLQRGHRVPDGKRYAGSPAEETTTTLPPRRRNAGAAAAGARCSPRPARLRPRRRRRADRSGRDLPDERADRRRRRAGAEALGRDLRGAADGGRDGARRHARLARRRARRDLRRSAARQPLPRGGQGLSALRLPSRHAADRRDRQQLAVLQPDVRRLGLSSSPTCAGSAGRSASATRPARTSAASRARTIRSCARSAPTRSPPTACGSAT